MAQGHGQQSAFQRGQKEREERRGKREESARTPPGLHNSPGRANATGAQHQEGKILTSGSKLKSGITITFPENQPQAENQPHAVGKLTSGTTVTCPEDQTALSSKFPSERSQGRRSTRGAQANPTRGPGRTPRRRGGLAGNSGEQAGGTRKGGSLRSTTSGQLSDASTSSDQLQHRMEQLRLEKDKANELNRQMAMQAEALMHDRAEIKAEKDRLERSRNEIAARLELLESMMAGPGEEGEPELLNNVNQPL